MWTTDPSDWEEVTHQADVIPLFKTGSRSDLDKYTGIRLLQILAPILENKMHLLVVVEEVMQLHHILVPKTLVQSANFRQSYCLKSSERPSDAQPLDHQAGTIATAAVCVAKSALANLRTKRILLLLL